MQRRHPLACSISRSLCFKYAGCFPPPLASASYVLTQRKDSQNAEEEFPHLDGMHLFRDFCMTARQDNSTNTTSCVLFEAARYISIKAAFWPNAATVGDSELPECAPSRRRGPDFDLLIPGAGFSGAKGRERPRPGLWPRPCFV